MTSVLMIAPMNAANFESGNANAGQVLTANGSGGTGWQAPLLTLVSTGVWTNQNTVFNDIQAQIPTLVPTASNQLEITAVCLDSFWVGKFQLNSDSVQIISLAVDPPPAVSRYMISVLSVIEN